MKQIKSKCVTCGAEITAPRSGDHLEKKSVEGKIKIRGTVCPNPEGKPHPEWISVKYEAD